MVNKHTTPAPAEPRVSDDDPQLRALMALSDIDKMRVGLLAAEDVIKRQDATIASQAAELAEAREILAGTDAGSLPNDMPLARIAEIRMDERHKYLWQVRDTCTRAEAAEAALRVAREALAQHHKWHLDAGEMAIAKDDKGEWIVLDMSAEYSDSTLCETTLAALTPKVSP